MSATVDKPATSTSIGTEGETLTQRIMRNLPSEQQAGGAGGSTSYEGLLRADKMWSAIKNMKVGVEAGPVPEFVVESRDSLGVVPEFDIVVCGGTLGIFMATAMQRKGWKVCVVERGILAGRQQEWNISEQELEEIVEAGMIGEEDIKDVIGIKFNPLRAGFKRAENDPNGVDTYCPDVLNLGVKPHVLVERAQKRFKEAGGVVMEYTAIENLTVHPDGARVSLTGKPALTSRLVLDCMGNGSPLVRQSRWGRKPDGICLVVGSCARGFKPEENRAGDIIYANSPVLDKGGGVGMQYFWEAFPAGSGPRDRTTYMFAYMDADPRRISLESMMEDYWTLMPKYQGVELSDLEVRRVLYGAFPTYKDSPLTTAWPRVCTIGDASGAQSPLSFGGFACLARHAKRLTSAFDNALSEDLLSASHLSGVNAYLPSLTATWMFQKSMSVGVDENMDPNLIVDLLSNNFRSMNNMGIDTLKPFLQDVVQFVPLLKTLGGVTFAAPLSIPPLLLHVGPGPLIDWMGHLILMGVYTGAHSFVSPLLKLIKPNLPKDMQYSLARTMDAWEYGSGLDYTYRPPEETYNPAEKA